MQEKDYIDKKGIPRRALVATETSPPDKGILTSVYLDEALRERGCSQEFIRNLYQNMHTRGLVTPEDVQNPKNAELLRAALLSTVHMDVQTIQALAEEQFNGRQHSKS